VHRDAAGCCRRHYIRRDIEWSLRIGTFDVNHRLLADIDFAPNVALSRERCQQTRSDQETDDVPAREHMASVELS
jgi:hypothetical protein